MVNHIDKSEETNYRIIDYNTTKLFLESNSSRFWECGGIGLALGLTHNNKKGLSPYIKASGGDFGSLGMNIGTRLGCSIKGEPFFGLDFTFKLGSVKGTYGIDLIKNRNSEMENISYMSIGYGF